MGMLPYRARNWQGRIIREDRCSEWVDLMGGSPSEKITRLKIKLDDQFHFEGELTEEMDGFYAKTYREDFTDLNNDERIKKLEQSNGKLLSVIWMFKMKKRLTKT